MRRSYLTRLPSRITFFSALTIAIVALCALDCPAAGDADTLLGAARKAASANRTERTRPLGFNLRSPYTDTLAQGGILIGFECGVGNFGDIETVYALRPIYLTQFGESGGQELGLFSDRRDGKRTVKSEVKRTVRVIAKPGYAVGGMTIRAGLNMNGLSLTYQRIKADRLDQFDFQESAWIGDRTGGSESSINSDGKPVIGIFGTKDDRRVSSLGLIYANIPSAAKKADPPKVEKPVDKPTEPKVADKAANPPADAPKADNAKPAEATPAPVADAAAAEEAQGVNWMPFAIFGLVVVPMLVLLLVYSRRQSGGTLTELPPQTEGKAAGSARAPALFEKQPPSDALQPWPSSGPPANEPQRPWPADASAKTDPVAPWPGKSTNQPQAWAEGSVSADAIQSSPSPAAPAGYGGGSSERGSGYGGLSSEKGSSYPGLSTQYPGLPPIGSESEPPRWDDPYGDPSRPRRKWGKQDLHVGETRESAAAKKECAGILFGIAALTMVCNFTLLSLIPDDVFRQAGVDKNMASWIAMILGCTYAGLGYWALSQPLIPTIIGLVIYGIDFLLALPALMKMPTGIWIKVAIIAALIRAVSSAAKASGTNFR